MFPAFLKSRWWGTSTPLYRRSVVDRAGAWKELWNEEDWEYDCRIAAQGVRLHYCDSFVSEQRAHSGNRLSSRGGRERRKLKDRATAHSLIYEHAKSAGISHACPEMQHFARELFLLARQCGAAGLSEESRMLFELAQDASGEIRGRGLDFRVYAFLAGVLGWSRLGKMLCALDRFR
jgi:hypothetical protein